MRFNCKRRLAVYAFSLLLLPSLLLAHTPTDPNFLQPQLFRNWTMLETAHFRIYYEARQKDNARRLARMAEPIHARISAWLQWQPKDKTDVVLVDTSDASNGNATVLPYNRSYLYLNVPVQGQAMDRSPWLEMLFIHEYTHIIQLDMVAGGARTSRDIFGRLSNFFTFLTFPQIFAPSWVTEGLAVYGESDNSQDFGRLHGAWFEASMRLEVARGLRSLTEESYEGYSNSRWPYGQIYLYGGYFFRFIEARYGRDRLREYVRRYGRNLIPWRMDSRAKKVFGISGQALWREFQAWLRDRFKPQLAAIRQEGLTPTRVLNDRPFLNSSLTAAANGDVYYYHDDSASYPQVRRLDASGRSETLFKVLGVQYLDWHDSRGLLISRSAVCDNLNLYTDLYLWKPGMAKPRRLTRCGRYPRTSWRPDGQAIAAVQLDRGRTRLVMLDAQGEMSEVLDAPPLGDVIGFLDFAPDGKSLLASVKREKSGWNLERFDLASRRWSKLTFNADMEVRPRYSADGQSVYFISDRHGVWNLRRLDLASGQVDTLSHVIAGIYEAVQMPDDRFTLVEYTARGLSVTALDQPRPASPSYAAVAMTPPRVHALTAAASLDTTQTQEKKYSPWASLRPRAWFPVFSIGAADNSFFGISIQGNDVLKFNRWQAMPVYYYGQSKLGGLFTYSFYNRVTFSATRQLYTRQNSDNSLRLLDDEVRLQLLFNYSFNSLDSSTYLAAGAAQESIDPQVQEGSATRNNSKDSLVGGIVRFDSTEIYLRAISPADGRIIDLTGESYDVIGNSDHQGQTWRLDWNEYVSLGRSHVLRLRLLGAQGDEGIRPYRLGGAEETLSELGGLTGLGRRVFALRGYASGLAELQGSNMALISAEWRIPLGLYYDGFFVPPLGLGRHSLRVFVDSGDAWHAGEDIRFKTGAGIEWNGETLLGYNMIPITLTVGAAHGFDKTGEDQIYVRLGLPL